MNVIDDNGGTRARAREIRVWDPVVRTGHWILVGAFMIAWLTGEEESFLHIWSGYVIAAVIALRLLWGFVGSRHARFRDFVRGPSAVLGYLRGLVTGSAPRYLGHNPAGGAMAIALLAALAATTVSGMMVYAIEEGAGPLAAFAAAGEGNTRTPALVAAAHANGDDHDSHDEGREELWEEVHEVSANLSLALVILHIFGVIASSLAHRENLPSSMVTGRKRADS